MTTKNRPGGYPVGTTNPAGGQSPSGNTTPAGSGSLSAGDGPLGAGYQRDGAEIYRRSFATIRAEADLEPLSR